MSENKDEGLNENGSEKKKKIKNRFKRSGLLDTVDKELSPAI